MELYTVKIGRTNLLLMYRLFRKGGILIFWWPKYAHNGAFRVFLRGARELFEPKLSWSLSSINSWQFFATLTHVVPDRKPAFQRWNSWTAFLVEVSGHVLESSQTRVLSRFPPSFFRCIQIKCASKIDLSFLVSRFFATILKPDKSLVFLKYARIRDCE